MIGTRIDTISIFAWVLLNTMKYKTLLSTTVVATMFFTACVMDNIVRTKKEYILQVLYSPTFVNDIRTS